MLPTSSSPSSTLDPTVFVVDDDPGMRASLRWLIESVGLSVVTCSTARDFLDTYTSEQPGCLLLDVRMPGMSGLDLQAELSLRRIALPVVIITGYAEVPIAVRAMKGGAFDFIEKPFSDEDLLQRIRRAITLDAETRRIDSERSSIETRLNQLTVRERDVLERVILGKSNKLIASELKLSTKTVEAHRAHVMEKMQAASLAELIRLSLFAASMNEPDNQEF
jgi:two-component system, LuxR family, response regulator FixJ